ncbi:RND efflux membrane fusion protein [Parvularcula bermudensis HTCC2503]|uniref:RND efflux membrane fusion protein n=1 Tax=Parvularcula bermudensis (strain ATCC BAA-594 / HTCC2503 / KCTC 12087) TaxID=314260 RepID=E0THE2_PARBH|nr:HlyD family efflux transporter periplasmic adaptor subunit [Parvularcula bermudensis]ADM10734.1 RND efflux membrane fusion protein [Parvularcula bermudensis HTCC2503]
MVLDHSHQSYFTTLQSLRPPKVMSVVALLLVVGVAAATAFAILVPWVQTTAGPGIVTTLDPEERSQELSALVAGRIDQWYVREGDRVAAGDPIVSIVDNDPRLLERRAQEKDEAIAEVRAAEAALRSAERDLARTESLEGEGLAAPRDVDSGIIRLQELRAQMASARARLARLDVDISRQSAGEVTAPRDGTVLELTGGDRATYVTAGQRLALFQPDPTARAVALLINGRDVPLVQPGADVRLEFEGFPALQFTGWPGLPTGTFEGVVVSVDPAAQPDGRFRVLVAEPDDPERAWPDDRFVRLGSTARGWILLETVSVGYEVWRQLNDFPPRYTTAGGTAR